MAPDAQTEKSHLVVIPWTGKITAARVPGQTKTSHLVVIPWMGKGELDSAPKAYSVHQCGYQADQFIEKGDGEILNLERLDKVASFTCNVRLVCHSSDGRRISSGHDNSMMAEYVDYTGIAVIPVPEKLSFKRLSKSISTEKEKHGILLGNPDTYLFMEHRQPRYLAARYIHDFLLHEGFISDPAARPKVMSLFPARSRILAQSSGPV